MRLSVQDVSGYLGLGEKDIYRLVRKGEIPFYEINDQYLFNRIEILEWATERHIKVSPDIFVADTSENERLPGLFEAISAGGFLYDVAGDDQASALRSIVDLVKLPDNVDRDFLYQVLLARETMGSTGIGNGIAIPHVRDPVVLRVNSPYVIVCFLKTPIDFKALDGKPVNILFTVISPSVQSHLHLLSRIGFVLHNERFREALIERASPEKIMPLLLDAESGIPFQKRGQD